MPITKPELRSALLQNRRSIPSSRLSLYDAAFAQRATDLTVSRQASAVAAYIGLPGEPGGHELVQRLSVVSEVWLPISLDGGCLRWSRFTEWEHLTTGAYGILEPSGSQVSHPPCDVVFVPALGVTPTGVRLGKGGGYYDRFLSSSDLPCVALVYSWEVREDIPQEPHDLSVNVIMTESELLEVPFHGTLRS